MPNTTLSSDVIGVIASFLPPTTRHQQRLMLVNHTWYQGVVQQDGMKPKPKIRWPLDALKQRRPRKLVYSPAYNTPEVLLPELAAIDEEYGPFIESLDLEQYSLKDKEEEHHLARFKRLTSVTYRLFIESGADDDNDCDEDANNDNNNKNANDNDDAEPCTDSEAVKKEKTKKMMDPFSELGSIASRTCLTNLEISHLTDPEHFRELSNHFPKLTALNFVEAESLSDNCLEHLTSLKKLQKLQVNAGNEVSDVGLGHLATMEELTEVVLSPSSDEVTSDGLLKLATKRGKPLKTLKTTEYPLTEVLHEFTSLVELRLGYYHFWAGDISSGVCLSKMRFLTKLDMYVKEDVCLVGMESLQYLKDITVSGSLTDEHVASITKCPSVTRLSLMYGWDYPFSQDADLERIGKMVHLERLILERCENLVGTGFAHLASLQKLTTLKVVHTPKLTDAGVEALSTVQSLTKLDINEPVKISDAALSHVANLKYLKHLSISSPPRYQDEDGDVGGLRFTDTGLQDLAPLRNLEKLQFVGAPSITDEGLLHLVEKLSDLEELFVTDCDRATEEGVLALKSARDGGPHLEVYFDWVRSFASTVF